LVHLEIDKKLISLKPKLNWVLDNFLRVYKVNRPITISYGTTIKGQVHIPQKEAYKFLNSSSGVPLQVSSFKWNSVNLPVFFENSIELNGVVISTNSDCTKINFDLFLNVFYVLSGWQEYHSTRKDKYGRFPADESILVKGGWIQMPVVNYYFEILATAIDSIYPGCVTYPKSHLDILMTHDIDKCRSGSIENSAALIKDGKILRGLWKAISRLWSRDDWDNVLEIAELEKSSGIRAIYFFIPKNGKVNGIHNADYKLSSPDIINTLYQLKNMGHEIGIHGSVGSGFQKGQLEKELGIFPFPVKWNRFHYLLYDVKMSLDEIEKAGIEFDSTMGFAETVGFRNGFCNLFYPYNIREDRPYRFLEYPLVIMDRTFIESIYMGLSTEESENLIKSTFKQVKYFGGNVAILWHNNIISGYKYRTWNSLFTTLLSLIKRL